jgi:hypothetical protein
MKGASRQECSKEFEESDSTVKKFHGAITLFIGVRGAVSRKRLDMTVAIFTGDVCPLRRSEGDVFYQNSTFCSWNRIVGVNRFPEGLVLGNWAKTLHPRNVTFAEFVNIFVNNLRDGKFCFVRRKH